jgi:hypothetical protein
LQVPPELDPQNRLTAERPGAEDDQ